jgi:hypothetical protein
MKSYEDYERVQRQRFQQYPFAMKENNDEYFNYPRSHPLSTSRREHPSPFDEDNRYCIVRGSDGRLYRVRKDDLKESYPNDTDKSTSRKKDEETEADARSDEHDDLPVQAEHRVKRRGKKDKVKNKLHVETKKTKKNETVAPKSSKRKKITVIVEDASDSEYEDDEMHSVWRNMRPCPLAGESWMEPVAAYL